jgi:hypothetical protein
MDLGGDGWLIGATVLGMIQLKSIDKELMRLGLVYFSSLKQTFR